MAPLAGRPPFATDEPDTYYETPQQPQRRLRQPNPVDPNARTSNYDVYDNYFGNDPTMNRQSGMGAVGMGFMNAASDDEDSDSDYDHKSRSGEPLTSKHKALAEATGAKPRSVSPPAALPASLQPGGPPRQQPIAAPRPGYAAPIAALNLARPEPTAAPGARQNSLNVDPFNPPSPSIPGTPHALAPPISPITPAFARPRPKKAEVSFMAEKPIPRGNTEDTLLPKRGEAGDDFWRRFSMVAKEDKRSQHSSSWLRKTQNGTNRLATWVWIVGLVLLLCAGGGIGIGWYVSHKTPDHQQPTTLSGDPGAQAANPSSAAPVGSGKPTLGVTSLHVTPTNTVARRAVDPLATDAVLGHRHIRRH